MASKKHKVEYLVIPERGYFYNVTVGDTQARLNELGLEGWQLILRDGHGSWVFMRKSKG